MRKRVRRIWWTCRKCGDRWGQPLPVCSDESQRPHLGDEFMKTICPVCVEKMAERIRGKKAVLCG